uniref:Transmembrane protein n=1 Tax=Parastrongyloides trichosuri TaxID=131310 RepID=A0A0N4Z977_PARTI
MGARCTSVVAVIIALIFIIISTALFFIGFTDFKPENIKDIGDLKTVVDAKPELRKLPIIDVEKFLDDNKKNNFKIQYPNKTLITKGSIYTYPQCQYLELSMSELKDEEKLKGLKPNLDEKNKIQIMLQKKPGDGDLFDFCADNSKLTMIKFGFMGAFAVSIVMLLVVSLLTLAVIFGCCAKFNLPMVIVIIAFIAFFSAGGGLGAFVYGTVNYYVLRGLESKEIAKEYGFPEQGNNLFYLGGCIAALSSTLVFAILMTISCSQRRREIIDDASVGGRPPRR